MHNRGLLLAVQTDVLTHVGWATTAVSGCSNKHRNILKAALRHSVYREIHMAYL